VIYSIFNYNFFAQFQAVNKKELTEELNKEVVLGVNDYAWSAKCDVSTKRLDTDKYFELLKPSINKFANSLQRKLNCVIDEAWLNSYEKGSYQEIHDHVPSDISCVFFLNHGTNFSEFYFRDRYSSDVSFKLRQTLGFTDLWTPQISAGDILFFPSNVLHGVSKHNSDTLRKTFSCDIIIH
tara:strand:+ start:2101 stop:2643 length:543 start_codon:yes stop_codon:yes gene_type:complete